MDNVELLRAAATLPCDPRHKQLLLESADLIERYHNALCKIAHVESETHMGWIAKCALKGK
jgi:hypothetical protein